jgi:hypothetical protein
MTVKDLKQLDKQLRKISNPFGTGFSVLRAFTEEFAKGQNLSTDDVVRQYIAWKQKK